MSTLLSSTYLFKSTPIKKWDDVIIKIFIVLSQNIMFFKYYSLEGSRDDKVNRLDDVTNNWFTMLNEKRWDEIGFGSCQECYESL